MKNDTGNCAVPAIDILCEHVNSKAMIALKICDTGNCAVQAIDIIREHVSC
jgi:hypothetical protein